MVKKKKSERNLILSLIKIKYMLKRRKNGYPPQCDCNNN